MRRWRKVWETWCDLNGLEKPRKGFLCWWRWDPWWIPWRIDHIWWQNDEIPFGKNPKCWLGFSPDVWRKSPEDISLIRVFWNCLLSWWARECFIWLTYNTLETQLKIQLKKISCFFIKYAVPQSWRQLIWKPLITPWFLCANALREYHVKELF